MARLLSDGGRGAGDVGPEGRRRAAYEGRAEGGAGDVHIIFDFDGTIHDTSAVFMPALADTIEWLADAAPNVAVGRMPDAAEVGLRLGSDAAGLWKSIAPGMDDGTADACVEHMRERILVHARAGEARLYAQATETLDTLVADDHVLSLLSNCRTSYLNCFTDVFDLGHWFSHLWCGEAFGWISKSEIFARVQGELGGGVSEGSGAAGGAADDNLAHGTSEGDCIVVGDHKGDIAVAAARGMKSVGCAYGFGGEGELSAATVICEEPEGLLEAIRSLM